MINSLNSTPIQYLCKKDKRLEKVILKLGDLKCNTYDDHFSFLVHEIVEQMLSIQAGNKIFSRLMNLVNNALTPRTIMCLLPEQIKNTGMSYKKVNCIIELSRAVNAKAISFASLESLSDNEVIKVLTTIRGIGSWTSKMYLLFVLNRPDVLPFEDGAFLQSYRWLYNTRDTFPTSVVNKCKKWSPYSSFAVRYMYRALDSGLTKKNFKLLY